MDGAINRAGNSRWGYLTHMVDKSKDWMSAYAKGGKIMSDLKSFFESYATDGGLIVGGYFPSMKACGGRMEKGGKASKDGDRHAYYIKAWKKEKDYNDENKPDLEEKKSLNWDEAQERQTNLEEIYYAVGIFAKKDNREVSISLGEALAKGGAIKNKKINIEVVVPKAKKSLLEDNAYELREFIAKSLTKKWFGHGAFDVETKKIADDKITLTVKIPAGKEYSVEDEFEFTEFLSKKLTKNWFGTGAFSVSIVK
jgi:hypothetical protein